MTTGLAADHVAKIKKNADNAFAFDNVFAFDNALVFGIDHAFM